MGKRITKREQEQFLALVAETGNVVEAAETIGKRPRTSYYTFAKANPEFKRRMDEARDMAIHGLESQVLDWAANGYTEATTEQVVDASGNKVGKTKQKATKKFDPRLALRVLERRHPDYKPKSETEVHGKTGVLIVPGIALTDEEFDAEFGDTG